MHSDASPSSTELRDAIEAADRRFMDAFNAGDVDAAVAGIYTTDAVLLPPGADMIVGLDEIRAFWQAARDQLGISRVELWSVDVQPAGEGAHQIGRVTLTVKGGNEVHGKSVVIWKQQHGEWRWQIDIWNLNG